MSDTTLRQIRMLQMIPRAPRRIDTGTLRRQLAELGFETTQRTVQRDLEKLSAVFPLVCDDRSRPHGWSWEREAEEQGMPVMAPRAALALKVMEEHATRLLPPDIVGFLQPYFRRAEGVLADQGDSAYRAWRERIAVIPGRQRLLPPSLSPGVADVVYEALFRQQRFIARYRRRGARDDAPSEYEVSPHGLVFRDNLVYLVASLWDYDDIRQLALHRILSAEPSDRPVHVPEGFSLDAYVRAGEFDYPVGKRIRLRAWFSHAAVQHLLETPLSEDQKVRWQEDGALLSATVQDTAQLRWWLLGLGEHVCVERPVALRRELMAVLSKTLGRYRD